jgi:muramoyltetrapeptide carboxypeptidase
MLTRREALAAAASLTGLGALASAGAAPASQRHKAMTLPASLKPGARIALPAPASAGQYAEDLAKCREFVASQGWVPVEMPHAGDQFGYLAGSDRARAEDLNAAFADKTIEGIICIRGGYGAMRILPLLDYRMIAKNPKVLMGFSDITALLIAISQKSKLVTFHGPNALDSRHPFTLESMTRALTMPQPMGRLLQPAPLPTTDYQLTSLHGGKAEGRLVGGNLTLLAHLMGTDWEPNLKDSLFFIEDVGEAPYRIDRMLTQLLISGRLKSCRGIVCGQFTNCDSQDEDSAWKVRDVLRDRLGSLGIPVVTGWAIGHVRTKMTLPVGVRAELDGDAMTLTVLDSAVV